jgi:hypothetical protein
VAKYLTAVTIDGIDPSTSASSTSSAEVTIHEVEAAVIGAVTDTVGALVTSLKQAREADLAEKGKHRQKSHRQAMSAPQEGLAALVGMKAEAERKATFDQVGVDPRTFMRLDVSTWEALGCTTKIMIKMLLNVLVLIAGVAICTTSISSSLARVTPERSAEEQFGEGGNHTAAELVELPDFEDVLSEDRSRTAVLSGTTWFACSLWIVQVVMAYFSCVTSMARLALILSLILGIPPLGIYLFYENGGSDFSGVWATVLIIVATGLGTVITVYETLSSRDSEAGAGIIKMAGKRAEHLLQSDGTAETSTRTTKQKLKLALISAVPSLFILGVVVIYVTVIFAAFGYQESSIWKAVVTIIAMGVKIVGNKGLLKLAIGKTPFITDWLLFTYEYATATLLRVLQMSIPDESIAINLSLFGAVLEVCVRIYFFNRYIHAGLLRTKHKTMTASEQFEYAVWGRMRVADGTNDMIVEYMSSLTAALLLIQMVPTGAFGFAGAVVVPVAVVLKLTMYQLAPELFLDFYVTFMEVQGGLIELHKVQWDTKAGSERGSKMRAKRLGTFAKATCLKVGVAVVIVGVVLLSNVK